MYQCIPESVVLDKTAEGPELYRKLMYTFESNPPHIAAAMQCIRIVRPLEARRLHVFGDLQPKGSMYPYGRYIGLKVPI